MRMEIRFRSNHSPRIFLRVCLKVFIVTIRTRKLAELLAIIAIGFMREIMPRSNLSRSVHSDWYESSNVALKEMIDKVSVDARKTPETANSILVAELIACSWSDLQ